MVTCFQRSLLRSILLCGSIVTGAAGQTTDYEKFKQEAAQEYSVGNLEQAEVLVRKALEVAERRGDERSIATMLVDLGNIYQREDRLGDAEQAYRSALTIFRRLPLQTEEATVLLNLGVTYSQRGRYAEALETLNQALKLNEKSPTAADILGTQILNSMGLVYLRSGKTKRAEVLLSQARATRRFKTEDVTIDAPILNNLGAIYQRQHRYKDAENAYNRALEMTEQMMGPAHPDLPFTLANLGALYTEMGLYVEAEDRYKRSLRILEKMNPVPHAQMARVYHELGKVYLRNKDKISAESALAHAVESARRNPTPDAELPELLEKYAELLESSGKLREAQILRTEARRTRAALALIVRVPKAPE